MMKEPQSIGAQLLSYHNIAYMMRLTADMRAAIIANKYVHAAATLTSRHPTHMHTHRYPEFVNDFLSKQFPKGVDTVPQWVVNALKAADIVVKF